MAHVTSKPDLVIATAATGLPTFKRPRFARLRIAVNEAMLDSDAAARLRWAVRNAAEPQTCSCGAPAAVAVRDGYQTKRLSGPVFYRCADHAAIPLDVPSYGNGFPAAYLACRNGCGYQQYVNDEGRYIGGGGPIVAESCAHEWSDPIPW